MKLLELTELTNRELKNILRENQIKNYSKLNKKNLVKKVNKLLNSQNGGKSWNKKNKKNTLKELMGGDPSDIQLPEINASVSSSPSPPPPPPPTSAGPSVGPSEPSINNEKYKKQLNKKEENNIARATEASLRNQESKKQLNKNEENNIARATEASIQNKNSNKNLNNSNSNPNTENKDPCGTCMIL